MLCDAIYSILAAASGLTDLVALRIYPDAIPQQTLDRASDANLGGPLPAVVYQQVSGDSLANLGSGAGLGVGIIQVSAYSETSRRSAVLIAEQVRLALHTHQGTAAGVFINYAGILSGTIRDSYERTRDGSDKGVYVRRQDFEVYFGEAV